MSLYRELRFNPPKLNVESGSREVIFYLVSCMCDNKYKVTLKKNDAGDFKLYGNGQHLSNFQFKGDVAGDCEWQADEGKWNEVIKFINSGTSAIESIKCRGATKEKNFTFDEVFNIITNEKFEDWFPEFIENYDCGFTGYSDESREAIFEKLKEFSKLTN